jgi:hypothetical protein
VKKSEFITQYLNEAHSYGFLFVIMRNYEYIHDDMTSDLDLYANHRLDSILLDFNINFALRENLIHRIRLYEDHSLSVEFISNSEGWSIVIDYYSGFYWRGIEYINSNELYNRKLSYNGLTVLQNGPDIAIVLMKELLGAKRLRKKVKKSKLIKYSLQDKSGFYAVLDGVIPLKMINRLYKHSISGSKLSITIDGIFIRLYIIITNPRMLSYSLNLLKVRIKKLFDWTT